MFISKRLIAFDHAITITGWVRKTRWVCYRKFAQDGGERWYGE